ncbi:11682_t:CDS:2, partial [Diversispora eburnea]
TCIWRPKKEGKRENISIKRFVSWMKAKHLREVIESQQLVNRGFPSKEYLFKAPEPEKEGLYGLLSESLAKALDRKKKSKEKKSKDIKSLLQNNDSPSLDEDEITNKDAITHAKKICSGISEVGMTRSSGISTRYNDYLNALDKIVGSTRSRLSNLLSKLSKLNVDYKNAIYELIVQTQKYKPDIMILEEYIFRFNLKSECE